MRSILTLFTTAVLATTLSAAPRCAKCERDSAGRIKRDRSARAAFVRANPCPANGRTRGPCPGYVVDHVIALSCGGPDKPENLQWQTVAEAKAKDRWEGKCEVAQK